MKKKEGKEIKYQSIEIKYPPSLYATGILILRNGKRLPFFMSEAYVNIDLACKDAEIIIKHLQNRRRKKVVVPDKVVIVPITFRSDVPLFKKYWKNPSVEISVIDRMEMFCNAINEPPLYEMMITPDIIKDKEGTKIIFRTASVLKNNSPQKDIESFMLTSKVHVSPEAKTAAIYSIEECFACSLPSGEMITKVEDLTN
jgi:hypothetical protein